MTVKDSKFYSDDIISPGYIESKASSTRKSKEDIRFKSLIPSEILEGADGIKQLLEAYYTFLNLDEFIYEENETFSDIVLDNKAVFRIPDPNNENNRFFTDEQGNSSTLTVTDASGDITTVPLSSPNVIAISNGNELPGTLASLTSEVGKTFQVQFFNANGTANSSFNAQTAKIVTPVKNWIGPGPSHILNNIEQAMDIDSNSTLFLELMQKEIAAAIPRSITVNKRNLYKTIIDYYKVRGSSDSIEIFFRLLFNDQVEVQYPFDKTLVPSSGNWDINASLPKGGQYLDNKGFLSNNIKIHDSLRYQRFSYLVRTGQNVSTWENVFNRLVHPAGFIFFGEILLLIELSKAILGEDTTEGDTLVRKVLSAMPERQPGAIGLEDIPLLVEMFASVFLPTVEAKIHKNATLSITLNSTGQVTAVEVPEPGFGYASVPAVTINGEPQSGYSITDAVLTPVLDSLGRIDSVTINNPGARYVNIFASVAANPNAGKLAKVFVTGSADKNFKTAPTLIFDDPTATDEEGNPLSSNVTATAAFTLNSDNEIPTTTLTVANNGITNAGSGYTVDPEVRIGSNANNEIRGKDIKPILILLLNHISDASRTDISNNYFNRKGTSYLTGTKRYGYNETLEVLGSRTIQSTDVANINKYNVKSYIHIN
tara:strand:- start:1126 stop:3090 length:1965 start_codon:yes stop_codon:yes gene_type:complete